MEFSEIKSKIKRFERDSDYDKMAKVIKYCRSQRNAIHNFLAEEALNLFRIRDIKEHTSYKIKKFYNFARSSNREYPIAAYVDSLGIDMTLCKDNGVADSVQCKARFGENNKTIFLDKGVLNNSPVSFLFNYFVVDGKPVSATLFNMLPHYDLRLLSNRKRDGWYEYRDGDFAIDLDRAKDLYNNDLIILY
jgi:hypothetical protein